MTKTKSTKRALLLSALSLLMCVSMLIGSTFAWFTDSVISGNNKIVAGNLDIELEYYNGTEWKTVNGATNLFDETLWEPGHTDVVYLRLRNIGSLALKYELAINIVSETPGINVAGDEFLLSDYIYMGVVEDINGQTNPYSKDAAGRAKAIADAAPAAVISEGYAADGEMVKGANDLYMAVVVYMPDSVDNDANYRGDTAPSIDLGINLVATQLMNEEDSFGNDYDEAAKYVISSDEKMIFNGTEFDTLVTNNGTVDMTNAKIENDNTGFENYGDATLNGVTVNAGTPGTQAYGYAINAYAGSTTVLNNVEVKSVNGAIGVTDGANLIFNSGSVDVDSKNTSGRYLFYVVGNGSTLTINGGNFDFNKTQNQKRAYIYAGDGTTVYVKGGTFGKASTRSGYTAGILGAGDVIITGGTFGFDPSAWVATGYSTTKVGDNWIVFKGEFLAKNDSELATAIAEGKIEIALADGTYHMPAAAKGKTLTFNGTHAAIIEVVPAGQGEANGQLDYNLDGSNVTFNGVTIKTNNQTYAGYARLNATYNDCVFENCYCLNGDSVFTNCTFNVSGDQYNVWTWGAPTATFNNCTFNSDGKAVLLYGTANTKLTVNGCTFNDNGGLTDLKAAIEIGNDYGKSYELIVNDTTVNGYEINDKGINTGSTLWANKNSMGQDKLNVVVDGVDVY